MKVLVMSYMVIYLLVTLGAALFSYLKTKNEYIALDFNYPIHDIADKHSQSYHDFYILGLYFSLLYGTKRLLCSFPLEGLSYIFNFNFALSLSIEQFILSVQIFEKALRKPLHCVIIKKIHLR